MRKLFLDDKRSAPKGYTLVTSANQCIKALEEDEIGVISLDYNLGHKRPTGYKVVKYMVERNIFPAKIIIHSSSRRGRSKMYRMLNRYKPKHVSLSVRPLPTPP